MFMAQREEVPTATFVRVFFSVLLTSGYKLIEVAVIKELNKGIQFLFFFAGHGWSIS